MKKILVLAITATFFGCDSEAVDSASAVSLEVAACGTQYKTPAGKLPAVCWHEEFSESGICEKIWDNTCCTGNDTCGVSYGVKVSDYLAEEAKSNGECTGDGSGIYQCAAFVQRFFTNRLHHAFQNNWGTAKRSLDVVEGYDLQESKDPVFVFRSTRTDWSGTVEPPRILDALVFGGQSNDFGHIVIATNIIKPSDESIEIPIIEENVARVSNYGPNGSCHHRVLTATKNVDGGWYVESGIGSSFEYTGFIRHNLAGIYDDVGWHVEDGTSELFRSAYLAIPKRYPGKSLGWAFDDHGGGPFVHDVRGIMLQNFVNTNPAKRFGTDGQTAIVLGRDLAAYVLKEGFWGAYKCIPGSDGKEMGGAEFLKRPVSNEMLGKINGYCQCTTDAAVPDVTYQTFEGGCMWWRPDEVDAKVHIHLFDGTQIDATKAAVCGVAVENNPPSADCHDDCIPGEQRCLNSSQVQICGHPGTDSCYHWLTLSCASGMSCLNDVCASSSSVSIATVSTGGSSSVSTGGSSSATGAQNCVHSAHRCIADPNVYQICILDSYSGTTDWMSFDCPSGFQCDSSSGNCALASVSTGGSSSVSVAIALVHSSGGSSVGGSSSLGNATSTGGTSFISTGGRLATGGLSSIYTTSSSNQISTGGAGLVNSNMTGGTSSVPLSASSVLHMHYEGPVKGEYWIGGWWHALDGRADVTWETSLVDCVDTNADDKVFDCDLPMIPSGDQSFTFQIYLPDGRFWGDQSKDPTGGNGFTIGSVTFTYGASTLAYSMIPNQFGIPYYNGLLEFVP